MGDIVWAEGGVGYIWKKSIKFCLNNAGEQEGSEKRDHLRGNRTLNIKMRKGTAANPVQSHTKSNSHANAGEIVPVVATCFFNNSLCILSAKIRDKCCGFSLVYTNHNFKLSGASRFFILW